MTERNAGIVVEVDRVLREESEEVAPVLALLDVSIAMSGHLPLSVHNQNQSQRRRRFVTVKRTKEERSKCCVLATTSHIVC